MGDSERSEYKQKLEDGFKQSELAEFKKRRAEGEIDKLIRKYENL